MAADENILLNLDVDIKNFSDKIGSAIDAAKKLGDPKNTDGLLAGLKNTTALAVGVYAAFKALQFIFDSVLEVERIKAVNAQFDILSSNAGIAGRALREGLEKSAAGLVTNHELIEAANKGLVQLGSNAGMMSETLLIARKAASVFGGTMIERFEQINQALATGQTRLLRNIGLNVDAEAAQIAYAKSVGKSASQLTNHEKILATQNAVMEKARDTLLKLPGDLKVASNAWTAFKVAMSEVGESVSIVFDKIWGQGVRDGMQWLRDAMQRVNKELKAHLGDGAEAVSAKSELLQNKLTSLKVELIDLEQVMLRQRGGDPYNLSANEARAEALRKKIEETALALKSIAPAAEEETRKPEIKDTRTKTEINQELADKAKLNVEIVQMAQRRAESESAAAESVVVADKAFNDQIAANHAMAQIKIAQIEAELELGKTINQDQARIKIAEIREQEVAHDRDIQDRQYQYRIAALDRYALHAQTIGEGITKGAAAESQKAALQFTQFGERGKAIVHDFTNNAKSNLMALGAGTKTATEAMKGFFLGFLADRAEAEGSVMLLSSVYPPNPLGIAAGSGLLILAGLLRSKAGSAASSSGMSAGGGGSVSMPSLSEPRESSSAARVSEQEAQKKAITIQIQGHYFETEQTRQRLTEIIRESADFTDFRVLQIGQQ